ncbi:MAG: DUF434 domain-containing protein [Isosphaeraceae bacterium]|nr:DUF434 domain-containing protein [Isosphaeraceae bacterium]
MPDTRRHRGPDPRDDEAFGPASWPALRGAVADLSWLLGKGYAMVSALKLVGDRWSLTERQRLAVRRCACGDEARERRLRHEVPADQLRGQALVVDGFNVLTTVEAALGGAVILVGRDRCFRDLAGVHGTYRNVEETRPSLALIGASLATLRVSRVLWLLDSPVSNSGRLKNVLLDEAGARGWDWSVELVLNPDPALADSLEIVATADSAVLDRCQRWFGLTRRLIEEHVPTARCVDLSA